MKLPSSLAALPDCFIQCVKSAKFIACTTRTIASLSDRSQEAIQEALAITDRITQSLLEWLQGHLPDLFAQADSVALLDMLVSFAELSLTSPRRWCLPKVRSDGPLVVRQGRHAIMAELPGEHDTVTVGGGPAASASGFHSETGFIPNDTMIDPTQPLQVVSGVNGSGKTT